MISEILVSKSWFLSKFWSRHTVPEGDLWHLRGDDLRQSLSSPDIHAGQQSQQKDVHGIPHVSLLGQLHEYLLLLQGSFSPETHSCIYCQLSEQVRVYLKGICPNHRMYSLG